MKEFVVLKSIKVGQATIENVSWPDAIKKGVDEADIIKAYQAQLIENVKLEAEKYRSQFITAMPGKQEAYRVKAELARRIKSAGASAAQSDLNLLKREASARGMTPKQLAVVIVDMEFKFHQINAKIEGIEAEAQAAIMAIDDQSDTAFDDIQRLIAVLKKTAEDEFAVEAG